MAIVAISRQLPWLEATLSGLAQGKAIDDFKLYKPWGSKRRSLGRLAQSGAIPSLASSLLATS